ncbi:MAG: hypothetical protein OEX81_01795 [Candidatus Pacebacteria bacterium]|nr:hypothetical protein [Candidatus Paceibacterota bacterium]
MICTCCFEKKNFEQRITTGVVKHWLEVGFSNNMAINRTIFNKVGYFKEWLGPGSIGRNGLDAEFILRCLLSGKSIYYNQKSICYHNSWFKISDFIYKNIDYELGGLLAYGYHYFKTKNTQVRSIFLSNISDLLDIGSIPYKFTIIVKDANLFSLISFTREYVTRFYLFIFGICLVYYKYLTDK